MRIVHVSVSTVPVLHRYGGAIQRRVMGLAGAQVQAGHHVTVISPGIRDELAEINGVRVRFVRCVCPLPAKHIEFQMRAAALMRKAHQPDIIHFHSQPEGAVTSWPLASTKVLSYDYFRFRRASTFPMLGVYRRILRAYDLLLPCSEYCRDASAAFWGFPSNRLHVLHNGVDTEQFYPDSQAGLEQRERLSLTGPIVLSVGRVGIQKGTDLLLDAFGELKSQRPGVHLVIAGPVERFEGTSNANVWIERIARAGGIYLGPVEEAGLAALYNMADVFVVPTREHEMFSMAAIEAQSCGVPVVASDLGGLRETVPSRCGLRFPPGDVHGLAAAIERMLDDVPFRQLCVDRVRRHAATYAWRRIEQRAAELYASCGRHPTIGSSRLPSW